MNIVVVQNLVDGIVYSVHITLKMDEEVDESIRDELLATNMWKNGINTHFLLSTQTFIKWMRKTFPEYKDADVRAIMYNGYFDYEEGVPLECV